MAAKSRKRVRNLRYCAQLTAATHALLDAGALELGLELFDAAGAVEEAFFAGIGRVRVAGHVAHDDVIFNPVDGLLLLGAHGRAGQKLAAGGHVHKADRVVFGMAFFFHGKVVLES